MVVKLRIKWTISRVTFGITAFALLIQLNSTENIKQHSDVFQSEKNTSVSCSNPDFDISLPKQSPEDKIELHIIQTIIENFATVLSNSRNEYIHRSKRGSIPSDNSSKLRMIENRLHTLQEQLAHLNSSISLSTEDKSRISTLKTTINEIHIILDGFQKENSGTIQFIINSLETSVLISMVQSIKSEQFSFAEKQLQLSDNDSIYRQVVQNVYDHQVSNIDLLLRFGGTITNLEKKFKLYEAIYYEIRNDDQIDIQILLRVGQSLRKGIFEVANGTIKDKSQSLIRTLWEENRNASVTLITAAFLKNEFWPVVKQIKDEIHRSCGLKSLGNVYKEVIDKIMDTLSTENILAKVDRNMIITEERIMIHEGIIDKLERNGSMYDSPAIPLVRYMKITWNDPGFNNEDWRYRYKIIINKLPRSLRNIVLSSSSILCIKNTRYNEYLYAANSGYTVGGYNQVFTGIPKYKHELPDFKWVINFSGDFWITIRNVRYDNYLYRSNNYAVISSKGADWHVLVDGEGVHLSYLTNEYFMYVSGNKRNDNMRYVQLYSSEGNPPFPSKWELVDCLDIP